MHPLPPIYTIQKKEEEKFLRQKTASFDFSKFTKKEIRELLKTMRLVMHAANGVGLSANQIGLNLRVFVAQVENKFYAVFNPEITKLSKEEVLMEEGCLSVPDVFSEISRPEKVWLKGFDANNKKIEFKAWGLLARVFQHEVDHLNGKLFIDYIK